MTSKRLKIGGALLAGVTVSILSFTTLGSENTDTSFTVVGNNEKAVYLSTSTIPFRVSGVVRAAKSTVVYAETAGVVAALPVREGSVVQVGEVVAIQSTPVVDARLALASAERQLSNLNQSLNTELRSGQAVQAAYRAYSASEIASLRAMGNDDRVEEGAIALSNVLEQSVLEITKTINYVNQNRALFSADGLKIYNAVAAELYGGVPNYFRGGLTLGEIDSNNLQAMLERVLATKDPAAVDTLALLMSSQLTALTKLFGTGEDDVFNRSSSFVDESMQTEYIAQRTAVLGAASDLQSTSAAFAQVIDRVLEDGIAQQTTVNVSDIDRELALTQASYAEKITVQADAVAAAGEAVVAAELSLARPRAAFAGTISRIFVDEGQYVMPGTPLLTLVGSGARELEVSVPSYLLPSVQIGQIFAMDGKTLGFVNRFSAVSEGGSGTVIITLAGETLPAVGSSLIGEVTLNTLADVYAVPRSYVHFDTDGAYLRYESGTVSRVEIVYDGGQVLYGRVSTVWNEPLQSAVSIAL